MDFIGDTKIDWVKYRWHFMVISLIVAAIGAFDIARKGGLRYGETDPTGQTAEVNKVHLYDLQATFLHLLGLDHERLTYRYNGRDFRLTDVHGHVVRDLIT